MKKMKALIMDVDGTLTDGGIYMGQNGEVLKRFSAKDGYAIANILPKYNIIPIIITGRESRIVENRCKELGIVEFVQGSKDKIYDMNKVLKKLQISLDEVAYIGDDLNDCDAMKMVAVRGCPADAVDEIKGICNYVSKYNGGYGAVRAFIEWIVTSYNMGTNILTM